MSVTTESAGKMEWPKLTPEEQAESDRLRELGQKFIEYGQPVFFALPAQERWAIAQGMPYVRMQEIPLKPR